LAMFLCGLWFHVYHAVSRVQDETSGYRYVYESVAKWADRASIDDSKVAQQQVVLINTAEHATAVFLPFIRYAYGHPLPLSYWTLSGAPFAHDLARPAPNQLEFTVLGDSGKKERGENFYRDERVAVKSGAAGAMEGLKVEIVEVRQGVARRFRFTFSRPLDDPRYLFLYSSRSGLRRFTLPAVGEVKRLPRAQFPDQARLPPMRLRLREPRRTRERLMSLIKERVGPLPF
jgi:hypothetical protein